MSDVRCGMTGRTEAPARVALRPDPALWNRNEFLTLVEASALFWPDGPIKTASLRTAQRAGQLAVARVAGKCLTTRGAIEDMVKNALEAAVADVPCPPPKGGVRRGRPDPGFRAKVEALMSKGATRRQVAG